MQTSLKTDGQFCEQNQNPFYWVFQSSQFANQFSLGEVGVFPAGGTEGSYVPPNVIDISSFLTGRDNILSKCNPPVPALESLNQPVLKMQESFSNVQNKNQIPNDPNLLIPKYTKVNRSANDTSSIDYNRWDSLFTDPQDLRYVIENFAAERGGLNTTNFIKSSWNNQNGVANFDPNMCKLTLDPSYACGPECSEVNGYPGRNPITGERKDVRYMEPTKPQPNYPFNGISSQDVVKVGAADCLSQFYYGKGMLEGSCPPARQTVLTKDNGQYPVFSAINE